MNQFNWSQGLIAMGGSAQDAARTRMQRDIAEMQAARAENLARFQLGKQQQFEQWKTEYGEAMANDRLDRSLKTEAAIAANNVILDKQRSIEYLGALDKRGDIERQNAAAAEDAREKGRLPIIRAQTQAEWQKALDDNSARTEGLYRDLNTARAKAVTEMQDNPQWLSADANARNQMLANDPEIQRISSAITAAGQERKGLNNSYAALLSEYGDPRFQPVTLPSSSGAGVSPGSPSAGASPGGTSSSPRQFDTSGGGAATPNNPLDKNVPASVSNPSADNAPALEPRAAPQGAPPAGSPPGSSASGMPPLVGQQRPPTITPMGPLVQGAQLIPGAAAMAARANTGAPSLNTPAAQAPALIPPTGMTGPGVTGSLPPINTPTWQ